MTALQSVDFSIRAAMRARRADRERRARADDGDLHRVQDLPGQFAAADGVERQGRAGRGDGVRQFGLEVS